MAHSKPLQILPRSEKMEQKYLTVKQLAEEVPGFTVGGVRSWLFYDTDDFRSQCSVKIGSKVLLDLDRVNKWLNSHREAA